MGLHLKRPKSIKLERIMLATLQISNNNNNSSDGGGPPAKPTLALRPSPLCLPVVSCPSGAPLPSKSGADPPQAAASPGTVLENLSPAGVLLVRPVLGNSQECGG